MATASLGKRNTDLATLLGLAAGFVVVGAAIILGGSATAFIDLPSVLIVIGGTFAITMICFSLSDVLRAVQAAVEAMIHHQADPARAGVTLLKLADKARRDGVLSLQTDLSRFRRDPFLHNGLQLVVDGASGDEAEQIMRRELAATAQRQLRAASVLRKAAEVAPAMGLIGTLVGLVQMLGNLSDPTAIGPGMAVALLTTFYGAVLANMVFSPLAAKLERNSGEDALLHNIYLTAIAAIGRQDSPRRLETLINTLLPPAQRVQVYG